MDEPKKTRISIGRFSNMTRLSVKALRLYDARGLLRPAFTDPSSGYRYYDPDQAYQAEIIRVLRSIEMPLPDILEIVATDNDEVLSARLQLHKERLQKRLEVQGVALGYLETMIESKEIVTPYDVALSEESGQRIAAVKIHTSLAAIAGDIQAGFVTLMQGLGGLGIAPTGAPMILYHNVIDQECEGDIEVAVPVGVEVSSERDVYGRELEAGKIASTVHLGRYEGIGRAYNALTRWVSDNGYDIAGPTREIYVNDPRTVAPSKLMTRLEFPVCTEANGV